MMKEIKIANFVVKYDSDPRLVTDNHRSDLIYLLDVDERSFKHQSEALVFLSECTSPITRVEELVPELKQCKRYKFILPDSHIKPKHQVTNNIEMYINEERFDWT